MKWIRILLHTGYLLLQAREGNIRLQIIDRECILAIFEFLVAIGLRSQLDGIGIMKEYVPESVNPLRVGGCSP